MSVFHISRIRSFVALSLIVLSGLLVGASRSVPTQNDPYYKHWLINDAAFTLPWRFQAPCFSNVSADVTDLTVLANGCYTNRPLQLTSWSITANANLFATNERCDIALFFDGTGFINYQIAVGDGATTVCDANTLTDADLDSAGESCTVNLEATPPVAAGTKWFLVLTGDNCSKMTEINVIVEGYYL